MSHSSFKPDTESISVAIFKASCKDIHLYLQFLACGAGNNAKVENVTPRTRNSSFGLNNPAGWKLQCDESEIKVGLLRMASG